MELREILFVGALAGFVASALNTVFWQPLWAALTQKMTARSGSLRSPSVGLHLVSLVLHLTAGLILGLLFWLSWGLTGIVSVPWWLRGLSFAGLTWGALCVPLLLSQIVSSRVSVALVCKSAIEWLTTCVLVGLACAWSWVGR
jgi:hypothetical protein